jgi:ATP-dependent DNA helicase RecG
LTDGAALKASGNLAVKSGLNCRGAFNRSRRKKMLDPNEIEALFRDMESDRVERKRSTSAQDKICEAICAFANDLPNHRKCGIVFIGQRDDGSCASINVSDTTLREIAGWRSDGRFHPFPVMHVRRMTIDGCTVAVAIVEPSDNPAVRLEGRIWIRVGPRRGIATPEEERRLIEKRRWGNLSYDQHGVTGSSLDDLDLSLFRLEVLPSVISPYTLAQNERTVEHQLLGLRMIRPDNTPTVAGILLIGKDPLPYFPGAYIQWRRLDGIEITDATVDERIIGGTLTSQVRRIEEFMDASNARALVIAAGQHERHFDYPTVALQQIVRNAIMHRTYEGTAAPVRVTWYSDRVEILSPGGPYGSVDKSNFGKGASDYRNPTIAEIFRGYRLVEKFGVGIALSRKALQQNGNPELQFDIVDTFINATMRKRT